LTGDLSGKPVFIDFDLRQKEEGWTLGEKLEATWLIYIEAEIEVDRPADLLSRLACLPPSETIKKRASK